MHLEIKVVLRKAIAFHYVDLGASITSLSNPFRTFTVSEMCCNIHTGLYKLFGCTNYMGSVFEISMVLGEYWE